LQYVIGFLRPLLVGFAVFGGTFSGRTARPGKRRMLEPNATGFAAGMALVTGKPSGKTLAPDEQKRTRQELRQSRRSLNPVFKRLDAQPTPGIMALRRR